MRISYFLFGDNVVGDHRVSCPTLTAAQGPHMRLVASEEDAEEEEEEEEERGA